MFWITIGLMLAWTLAYFALDWATEYELDRDEEIRMLK